jgi:DNA-binding XRE family transcriptional regulator
LELLVNDSSFDLCITKYKSRYIKFHLSELPEPDYTKIMQNLKLFDCSILIKNRNKQNFSQQKMAEILEVNQTTIHRWESGDSVPDANHLLLLADTFKIEMKDFYSASLPPPPKTK